MKKNKVKIIKYVIEKNHLYVISQKHTLIRYRISKLNNYTAQIGKWKIINTNVKCINSWKFTTAT